MREKSRLLGEGNVVAMILNREKQIGSSRYLDSPAGEVVGEDKRRTGSKDCRDSKSHELDASDHLGE